MEYYIGWDVGGWGCAKNSVSKDAFVLLDDKGSSVKAWRGSISKKIADKSAPIEYLKSVFKTIEPELCSKKPKLFIAIDAILGLPTAFTQLWQENRQMDSDEINGVSNRYLYRETERIVSHNMREEDKNLPPGELKRNQPLSLLRDSLGSQATKALHFIHSLGLEKSECGLFWQGNFDDKEVIVLETYPSAVRIEKNKEFETINADIVDAIKCAKVAQLFAANRTKNFYSANIARELAKVEGWIWQPNYIIDLGVEPDQLLPKFFKPIKSTSK